MTKTINHHQALIYTMVTMIGVDGRVGNAELGRNHAGVPRVADRAARLARRLGRPHVDPVAHEQPSAEAVAPAPPQIVS